jgi:hypothetical protein
MSEQDSKRRLDELVSPGHLYVVDHLLEMAGALEDELR